MDLRNSDLDIPKKLRELSFHNFIGLCSIFLLGLVDSFFLGLYGETDFATAIFCSPIIFLIISMFIGVSNAKMVFISRSIKNSLERLNEESNFIDFMVILIFCLISIIMIVNMPTIVDLFNVENELRLSSIEYTRIYYIAGAFCVYNTLLSSFLRGIGDSKIPARVMALTSIINIILDPLFIFYFDLGSTGAAYATSIAWIVSSIYVTYKIRINKNLTLKYSKLKDKEFFSMLPSFVLTQSLNAATMLLVFYMVGKFGTNVLAGLGFGIRLDKFIVIISFAFGSAMSVFVGQNLENKERCIKGYKSAFVQSILLSLVLSVLLYSCANIIALAFGLSEKTVEVLKLFLMYNVLISFFNSIYVLNSSFLNASSSHNIVLASNLIKTMITLPICLYVFISMYNWHGALIGLFVNSIISNIVLFMLSKKKLALYLKEKQSELKIS